MSAGLFAERVARALAVIDQSDEENWRAYEPDARAAIRAMREPTDEMIDAAAETAGMKAASSAMQLHQARGYGFEAGAFLDGSPLHQAWRAMIDAASGIETRSAIDAERRGPEGESPARRGTPKLSSPSGYRRTA